MNGAADRGGHVTPETLIARARALAPDLRAQSKETEAARRISDSTIDALRNSGLFRLMQPARYGGLELGFEPLVRITMEIAAACGSTGWVYSVGAFHAWNVALFPAEAQDDVWGDDPEALSASSYIPAGTAVAMDGGLRLSGTWPFASGCDNFGWIVLGARVLRRDESGPPDIRFCLVPKADFAIDDNWTVVGLAGTGSKNVVLDDVFVPWHRTLPFEDARDACTPGAAFHDVPLYKLPFFAVASFCLVGPALGIARGAVDAYIDEVRERETGSITGVAAKASSHLSVQMRISEAAGLVDAATELVLRDCREALATAQGRAPMPGEQRARNKRDQALAISFARTAVQRIVEATGARGLFEDHPIQRAWRDIHAAGSHITLNWDIVMPAYGRTVLGLDPGIII